VIEMMLCKLIFDR